MKTDLSESVYSIPSSLFPEPSVDLFGGEVRHSPTKTG